MFDLRLRKGNNEKRGIHGTIRIAWYGRCRRRSVQKKVYDGSYLINYRYSTLSLLGKIGVPLGDAITNFQDLSFNLYLPTKRLGRFTVFGFGGLSYQTTESSQDSLRWKEDAFLPPEYQFLQQYRRCRCHEHENSSRINPTSKTAFWFFSGTQNGYEQDELQYDLTTLKRDYEQRFLQNKITLSSVYTWKMNAKSNIRTGFILNQLGYELEQRSMEDTNVLITQIAQNGNTQTIQAFFQWNYRLTEKLTTNVGMHYMQLLLNNSTAFEPRASLKYDFNQKHHATLGYGLHSQLQPIGIYFTEQEQNGVVTRPNENLKLSKAHHLVVGYDWVFSDHSHVKTEVYYQHFVQCTD